MFKKAIQVFCVTLLQCLEGCPSLPSECTVHFVHSRTVLWTPMLYYRHMCDTLQVGLSYGLPCVMTVGWDGLIGFHRTVPPILLGTVGWDGLIGFHRTVPPILLGTVGWDGLIGFHRTVPPILLGTVGWDGLIGFHRTVPPILRGEWTVLCGQWI